MCHDAYARADLNAAMNASSTQGFLIQKHATVARLKQKITAAGIVRTQTVSCESAASVVINLLEQHSRLPKPIKECAHR